MHLHLKDLLSEYEQVYTFWCFAFESFNDVLGLFKINNKQ